MEIDFARDIQPLLKSHCFECHGPEKNEEGLSLATRAGALAGGDTGQAIVLGLSVASLLVDRIEATDPDTSPIHAPRATAVIAVYAWRSQPGRHL